MSADLSDLTLEQLHGLKAMVEGRARENVEAEIQRRTSSGPSPSTDQPTGPRDPRDRMNKTERRFEIEHLERRQREGEIVWWGFEAVKVRVGVAATWYHVDFPAFRADGVLEMNEVKGGHTEEDARVKFQAAARQYPFWHWRWWEWSGGRWRLRFDYSPAEKSSALTPEPATARATTTEAR